MKFEAATIKDIAKALKLSTSTVSRALRDSYEISPATKKKVMEYAEKINYHPNPIALSLKEKRSRTIGVVVCEIANSFFSQVINGIESIAYEKGYNVIIAQSRESFKRELINLQYLTSRSVDGLIISVSMETTDFAYLNDLHTKGLPIVFFDRIVEHIETHKVIVDNFQGAYDACDYLAKNGFKHIAVISSPDNLSISKERIAGYKDALQQNGLAVQDQYIRYCSGIDEKVVETVVDSLLSLKTPPDAIFTTSDKITMSCLSILQRKGIDVPGRVALLGFSNSPLNPMLRPALTNIYQPAFEMGEVATRYLLELIESKRQVSVFETVKLPAKLTIRDSTAKIKT